MQEEILINKKLLTVTSLNKLIKTLLETDELLQDLSLKGEVSDFKVYPSGHAYFTMKDEGAQISCVFFGYKARNVTSPDIKNGDKVEAQGRISVYEKRGNYQFVATSLKKEGLGDLYAKYQALKEKLEKEGLFATEYKKPILDFAQKIGVVTSVEGAAVHDIITTIRGRDGGVEIIISPTKVQGEDAPASIISALENIQKVQGIDIVIIGRGGGSFEDLMAFSDEGVVRAVFACKIPIISAVGHETDFSLCDFAADYRAPTPTGAAQIAVFPVYERKKTFENMVKRLYHGLNNLYNQKSHKLQLILQSLPFKYPLSITEQRKIYVDELDKTFNQSISAYLLAKNSEFEILKNKLLMLNPEDVLNRGYCICKIPGKRKIISSLKKLKEGQGVEVYFKDGSFEGTVDEIKSMDFLFDNSD